MKHVLEAVQIHEKDSIIDIATKEHWLITIYDDKSGMVYKIKRKVRNMKKLKAKK